MELTDSGWVRCREELERSAKRMLYAAETRGRFDAADVVQDGLLQILTQQASQDEKDNEPASEPNPTWLKRIAKGHTLKNIRKHTSDKRDARRESTGSAIPLPAGLSTPEMKCIRNELSDIIYSAIEDLEPRCRYIVRQHVLQGLPMTTVAESLGSSPRVCRRLLDFSFKQLRSSIIEAVGYLTGKMQTPPSSN